MAQVRGRYMAVVNGEPAKVVAGGAQGVAQVGGEGAVEN